MMFDSGPRILRIVLAGGDGPMARNVGGSCYHANDLCNLTSSDDPESSLTKERDRDPSCVLQLVHSNAPGVLHPEHWLSVRTARSLMSLS